MPLARFEIRTLTPTQIRDNEGAFLAIGSDVPEEYWTVDNFLKELPAKWCLSFAAWDERGPIAYAILSRSGSNQVHLHHLMVSAAYRSTGIGSEIIAEVERRARKIGCTRLILKVAVENVLAHRFYFRHGFLQGEIDGAYLHLFKELQP